MAARFAQASYPGWQRTAGFRHSETIERLRQSKRFATGPRYFACGLNFGGNLAIAPLAHSGVGNSHLRGQIVVLNYLMTGLFAGGLAPLTVALVTDRVFHADNAIGLSLGLVPLPAIILGLFVTYAGMGRYDRTRAKFKGAKAQTPLMSSNAVSINPAADPARI